MPSRYWCDLVEAANRAANEAVNTGGIVHRVISIELGPQFVRFIGVLPPGAVEFKSSENLIRPKLVCHGVGTFHTTWGAIIKPDETIGFMVLQHPVLLIGPKPDDSDLVYAPVFVRRSVCSIPETVLGLVCCVQCNKPIAQKRLEAIPGVRICRRCKEEKEEFSYGATHKRKGE